MGAGGPKKRTGLSVREYVKHRRREGLVGANKNAVQKALKSGRIRYIDDDPRNGIDPEKADRNWSRNTNPARLHPQAYDAARESLEVRTDNGLPIVRDGSIPDYHESRARREHYEAELRRLDLGERMGQLVATELVARQVQAMTAQVRQVLLTLPSRIAPLLVSAEGDLQDAGSRALALENELSTHVRELLERWQADPTGAALRQEEELET